MADGLNADEPMRVVLVSRACRRNPLLLSLADDALYLHLRLHRYSGVRWAYRGFAIRSGRTVALSKRRWDFLVALAAHFGAEAFHADVVESVFGLDADGGPLDPMNWLQVTVTRLNPKLRRLGLRIENVPYRSWRLVAIADGADSRRAA